MLENTLANRFKNTIIKRLKKSEDPKILTQNLLQDLNNINNQFELVNSSIIKHESDSLNFAKKQFITPFFFNSIPMNRKAVSQRKKKEDFNTLDQIKNENQVVKNKHKKNNLQMNWTIRDKKQIQQDNLIQLNIKAKSLNQRRQHKTLDSYKTKKKLNSTFYHIKTPLNYKQRNIGLSFRERESETEGQSSQKSCNNRFKVLPVLIFRKRKSSSVSPWDIQNSPLLPTK